MLVISLVELVSVYQLLFLLLSFFFGVFYVPYVFIAFYDLEMSVENPRHTKQLAIIIINNIIWKWSVCFSSRCDTYSKMNEIPNRVVRVARLNRSAILFFLMSHNGDDKDKLLNQQSIEMCEIFA